MSPSDYEMIEQGYDPPRMTNPLEAENRRLREALAEARKPFATSPTIYAPLLAKIDAALAAEPASGEAE